MLTLTKIHPKLAELQTRLSEISDINRAAAVLHWDQKTYMPAGGAGARGQQLATLQHIAHQKFTDPAMGELLEDLRPTEESLPADSDAASLIRLARRQYYQEAQIPGEFVSRMSQHQTECYTAWAKARPENNFAAVCRYLEKTLELSRELANFFPGYEHIADPLIDQYDFGIKAANLQILFAELRSKLIPLVQAIASQPPADNSCLHQHFPQSQQLAFTSKLLEQIGYDFQRGRQDLTLHPFMTKFSQGDVRITTRVYENSLDQSIFSSVHEMGHAFYEQGINSEYESTPLGDGTSSGIHESQSRLWENLVGRSRHFWQFFYPQLQAAFPSQLGGVSLETFYRAVNKVARSLIRTDADEVTYNLHIAIRFDLELAMLECKLAVKDLPEAWRDRYRTDLGLVPQNDSDGVMQDIHWYGYKIGGMFQGYTLGNLASAQFFETALQALPEIPEEIAAGKFDSLHNWLKEQIYQHGSKYTTQEILTRVTGSGLKIEPFMRYLEQKYGKLYGL